MELSKIEILLEKYFQGETSIAEEKELCNYFSSQNVLPHLEQYKSIFVFFTQAKQQEFTKEIPLKTKKAKIMWLSIAATIVFMLGLGTFYVLNNDAPVTHGELGTYDSPEVAFIETQKALALISSNVNIGMKSVMYVQEYETAKNRVFKK
jgi:hypothetical protein